jgi:hypothetical protein
MGPALIGLLGAVLGVGGTLLVAALTRRAASDLAERGHREERLRASRELAADGFVLALEAVSWLGIGTVEDSVDPQFADTYGPKTESAKAALQRACEKLNKVYALQGSSKLGIVAGEIAIELGELLYAYEGAQNSRRRIVAAQSSGKSAETVLFDRQWKRLVRIRESLAGADEHRLDPAIPEGSINPGSAMDRLRLAIAEG